ncbi:MAG: FKBP-type peptidyl-prolyl cis-trans isomerase [Bacteroidetes bacterium]|nr:FKBP-type peptidyl-prolyl cis-trans isomerase [Bacteroidota bacterium]MBI3481931.1 FKBP-type peptidyl-prolyl cis-trans isomerase [Bacteroidota bacterium]
MRASILLLAFIVGACSLSTPPSFDFTGQYVNDTTAIRSYLNKNGIAATKLSQGIWFIIDSAAAGIRPTFSDSMLVSYKMKLMANESTVDQAGTPVNFILPQLIFGLRIAMPYFQKGSKGRIFIPSYYGYQNVPYGNVPANSNLIFDFKLTNVKDSRLKTDTVTVNKYLKDHSINAQTDVSGLRYTIDSLGSGPMPKLTDLITVTYVTKDMSTGKVVDQSTSPTRFRLSDVVLCWQVALPLVPEGSKLSLYVPSSLSMVPGTANTDPSFSNLIYTIQLKEVIHH